MIQKTKEIKKQKHINSEKPLDPKGQFETFGQDAKR